jgi:hypothetical protein
MKTVLRLEGTSRRGNTMHGPTDIKAAQEDIRAHKKTRIWKSSQYIEVK